MIFLEFLSWKKNNASGGSSICALSERKDENIRRRIWCDPFAFQFAVNFVYLSNSIGSFEPFFPIQKAIRSQMVRVVHCDSYDVTVYGYEMQKKMEILMENYACYHIVGKIMKLP